MQILLRGPIFVKPLYDFEKDNINKTIVNIFIRDSSQSITAFRLLTFYNCGTYKHAGNFFVRHTVAPSTTVSVCQERCMYGNWREATKL